jgi:hypothetical protein
LTQQHYILFILLIFFACPFISKGQASSEDVIYLKNGNIIYGTIIENKPGQYVSLKTEEGNVLTNKWEKIFKITKTKSYMPKKTDTVFNINGFRKPSGYVNITEINGGFDFESHTPNYIAYGIRTINGYLINPEFSIGAGLGYDNDNYNQIAFLPIFADFRFYTFGYSGFILGIDIGASPVINPDNNYYGGLMLSFCLERRIHVSKKIALNISVEYNRQYYTYNYYYSYYYSNFFNSVITTVVPEDLIINNLKLNLGLIFE